MQAATEIKLDKMMVEDYLQSHEQPLLVSPPEVKPHEAVPSSPPPLAPISAADLAEEKFAPLVEPVKDMICEGLTLLCGASKIGKSWLVLQMCCAVAQGKPFIGRPTLQGSVLYLALEDSRRRLQSRMQTIKEPPSERLFLETQCLTLDTGLLEQLEAWIKTANQPRMIVIDTLQKIRGDSIVSRANAYAADYAAMAKLKELADQYRIAIVLVHHLNKMQNVEDPFEKISGSTGLMGAADTTLIIARARGEQDAAVKITGRDVWEAEFTLRLEGGRWHPVDAEALEREEYEQSPIPRTCRKLLEQSFDGAAKVANSDFINASIQFAGESAAISLYRLKAELLHFAPLLRKYDKIIVEFRRVKSQNGVLIRKEKI